MAVILLGIIILFRPLASNADISIWDTLGGSIIDDSKGVLRNDSERIKVALLGRIALVSCVQSVSKFLSIVVMKGGSTISVRPVFQNAPPNIVVILFGIDILVIIVKSLKILGYIVPHVFGISMCPLNKLSFVIVIPITVLRAVIGGFDSIR